MERNIAGLSKRSMVCYDGPIDACLTQCFFTQGRYSVFVISVCVRDEQYQAGRMET